MKHNRGIIDPLTLYVVGALALGVVLGSYKPFAGFKKGPPTKELTEAQAALKDANERAKAAEEAKEGAVLAERAKMTEQLRSAQGDALGAVTALKKVPEAHKTAEVKLASALAQRVDFKLGAAIGALPADQQQAMLDLIEQALSGKEAEIAEANRKLAERDAQFKAITAERDQIATQIPILEEKARKAERNAQEKASEVNSKTEEVKTWADKTRMAELENGSLWGSVKKAAYLLIGLYVFFALVLPAIVKHLASENPLKTVLRDASGYALNPLTYHDAKKKLTALKDK